MYCPQCGTESSNGQQYCRSCGANLKVIGKALTLSEAIARSDRGLLPKMKEMVKNLKVDHVTEEVARALERLNNEIVRHPQVKRPDRAWWQKPKKTAAERREAHIVKGTISFFSGIGIALFFYYFSAAVVLKLPPDVIASIPLEIEPLVHVLWLLGLLPMFSGVGHIVAGLLIRPSHHQQIESANRLEEIEPAAQERSLRTESTSPYNPAISQQPPSSVTERTTNLLDPPS